MKSKIFIATGLIIVALAASVIILANIWSHTPYGRLDPKVAFALKFLSRPRQDSFKTGMSIHENRLNLEKMASLVSGAPAHPPIVKNIRFAGPAGPIPARIYAPGSNRHPSFYFFMAEGGSRKASIHTTTSAERWQKKQMPCSYPWTTG